MGSARKDMMAWSGLESIRDVDVFADGFLGTGVVTHVENRVVERPSFSVVLYR